MLILSEWREKEKPLFVLQSVHEVEERRLETMLVTLHSQANQLNLVSVFYNGGGGGGSPQKGGGGGGGGTPTEK